MKSTLKNHTYQCKCGALTKELVWDKELPTAQFKCIECGLCAYVCTSKIHVTDYVRKAKKLIG